MEWCLGSEERKGAASHSIFICLATTKIKSTQKNLSWGVKIFLLWKKFLTGQIIQFTCFKI